MTRYPLFFMLLLLLVFGCQPVNLPTVSPISPLPSETVDTSTATGDELAGTHWTLISMLIEGEEKPVVADSVVTLDFDGHGRGSVSGESGCNAYGGSYQVQGDALTFSEVLGTEKGCPDDGIMQQERVYFLLLNSVSSYSISDGTLTLWDAAGQSVLIFAQDTTVFPAATATAILGPENPLVIAGNDLSGIRWRLSKIRLDGVETDVLAGNPVTLSFVPIGGFRGNGGCNNYSGTYAIEGNTITFGQYFSTLMACGDNSVTLQEQDYFRALGTVTTFEVSDEQLTFFDENGQGVLIFTR